MKAVKRWILVFLMLQLVQLLNAQPNRMAIDSIIRVITVESYQSHFDSLKTNKNCNRKVMPTSEQSDDHNACRDYIFRFFQTYLGEENVYQHRFESGNYSGLSNVIGFKEGKNKSSGIWVISAHYDSNNNMELNPGATIISPGANDNGTGVAAVLEMVRTLAATDIEASVLFAAWDFEEVFTNGYPTGSNNWFNNHVKKKKGTNWSELGKRGNINRDDIRGNINFDMFGNPQLESEGKPVLWACYASNQHIGFADSYVKTVNDYVPEIMAVTRGRLILSDHYTFAANKIQAVENLESGYTRDSFYHTYSDHLENPVNIDFQFAVHVTRGGFAFLLEQILFDQQYNFLGDFNFHLIRTSETPQFYYFDVPFSNATQLIHNQFGTLQRTCQSSVSIGFAPPKEGWYYIQYISGAQQARKKTYLNKKEGIF